MIFSLDPYFFSIFDQHEKHDDPGLQEAVNQNSWGYADKIDILINKISGEITWSQKTQGNKEFPTCCDLFSFFDKTSMD